MNFEISQGVGLFGAAMLVTLGVLALWLVIAVVGGFRRSGEDLPAEPPPVSDRDDDGPL
jgi:hypothetical protein